MVRVAAPLKPIDIVIMVTDNAVEQPVYTSRINKTPGRIWENKQKNFLIAVVVINFFESIQSPTAPKIVAENNLARYGNADIIPAAESSKPRTLDTNLGPTVIMKYKPHKFP